MALSTELISEFVKVTNDNKKEKKESTVYGTIVKQGTAVYVRLDGSNQVTPVISTMAVKDGERVRVKIKNHTATVTGNISSPSASDDDLQSLDEKVSEFETVLAKKVDVEELNAQIARIDDLTADNATITGRLEASEASIGNLEAANATITETLTAANADIENLKTTKLDADVATATYATIENLNATNANVYNLTSTYGEFAELATNKFTAIDAVITSLNTTYANIDFSNIGKAAMEYFYAQSGLIKDVVVGDQTITGELIGVTIKGDLIESNTVIADKLVVKGEDGLYYKLNTDGVSVETEQTDYNSLSGSVIRAKSVTADKIAVTDLEAFDATIGGFTITANSIYSGVKETVGNVTRGVYMDNDGQFVVGDANNYLKYFKDTDETYKLSISAGSIEFSSSGKNLTDALADIDAEMESLKGNVSTLLRIESSKGTVFKNNNVSTVLSAVVYYGSERITDITKLREIYGDTARIQWNWQKLNEDAFGAIPADDSRIGNNGFTFTLGPADVNTKVTFMCQLMV